MKETELAAKEQAFAKVVAAFSRSNFEISTTLYAVGAGGERGDALTDAQRDELLAKLEKGERVAVEVDMLAYEQRAGVRNRNSVRFRDGAIKALGESGKGKPFLKDHEQWDSLSVAGRILESKPKKLAEGQHEIRMRARLTAKWAVDLALRDLLFACSIGWEPTGPIECSACGKSVTACYHWPGMRVSPMPQNDGSTRFVWDRNGATVVEWIYTSAKLKECSMCPIGGVELAGFDGIRAALSIAGFEHASEFSTEIDDLDPTLARDDHDKSTRLDPLPQPARMSKLDAAIAAHTELNADERKAFAAKLAAILNADLGDIAAAALAADPVVHTTKDGTAIRKSDGAVALMLAKQTDAQAEAAATSAAALATANEAARVTALTAKATTLFAGCLGTPEQHAKILGAIESDADCVRVLTGILAGGKAKPAPGVNPELSPQPDGPQAQLDALVAAHEAKHSCSARDARLAVSKTTEGRALYNQIELAKKSRK